MRKYSLRQFNAYMKRNLKKIEKNRRLDPLYNYEQAFEESETTETDATIYEINDEEYSDIFE